MRRWSVTFRLTQVSVHSTVKAMTWIEKTYYGFTEEEVKREVLFYFPHAVDITVTCFDRAYYGD